MPYQFAIKDQNYADYASGRVIYSQPGAPAFPVRVASEMFQRALAQLQPTEPLRIYDPCCGGAYHLCAIGFLHGNWISSFTASDIDQSVIALAKRNLGLLTPAGLQRREQEIRSLFEQFGKESHAQALASAAVLKSRLQALPGGTIASRVFQANALDPEVLGQELESAPADLVLTDLPYGWMTAWQLPAGQTQSGMAPAARMLNALLPVLASGALVATAADKSQKVEHPLFRRVDRFQIGKRQVTLLKRIEKP